ncbi:MAG: hypothetical protein GY830_10160 [Bacteroidetes bacterium]|nr:hypothetical protein [Bacteroidota bacterium]
MRNLYIKLNLLIILCCCKSSTNNNFKNLNKLWTYNLNKKVNPSFYSEIQRYNQTIPHIYN